MLVRSSLLAASALALVASAAQAAETTTPIEHVVVIFQENVSFDHYFGTYPHAANTDGTPFQARPDTPGVNGLTHYLLTHNPNGDNPFRLSPAQAFTCDMYHGYTAQQMAYNGGRVDGFEVYTAAHHKNCPHRQVMGYFDGNTVTALWTWAQHYAMADNMFGSTYGPSTPGALNLVRGNTANVTPAEVPGHVVHGTLIGDLDPRFDDCSKGTTAAITGRTIGDLLNDKGLTWGWFQGGFKPTETRDGKAVCGSKSTNIAGMAIHDYDAHHNPFQYFEHLANPHHLPPESPDQIGHTDQANHLYDLSDFWTALDNGNLPAVSFLKAKHFQDGHAGKSDPIDEQNWLVPTVNRLMASPAWDKMAIIITYDDSDGWYDHVMPPALQASDVKGVDMLFGENGRCGTPGAGAAKGRCGLGPRVPLLVISPFARQNYVDSTMLEHASVLRFIEDNWRLGRVGNGSFDARAESLTPLFAFHGPRAPRVRLNDKGLVTEQ